MRGVLGSRASFLASVCSPTRGALLDCTSLERSKSVPTRRPRMTKKVLVTGCVALMVLAAGLWAADKPKSIKDVMAHHKKDQLRAQITAGLKEAEPDWAALQSKTKEYAAAAAALADFEPPKGDKEAFASVAKTFAASVKQ